MSLATGILARGPWLPSEIEVSWRQEPFTPDQDAIDAADLALAQLRDRGSPSHDGLAARLRDFEVVDGRLRLECEPVRWALRLLSGDAMQSLSALCVVRFGRRPLARRPPRRVAGDVVAGAGRWARRARSRSARTRPTRWSASCTRSGRSAPSA